MQNFSVGKVVNFDRHHVLFCTWSDRADRALSIGVCYRFFDSVFRKFFPSEKLVLDFLKSQSHGPVFAEMSRISTVKPWIFWHSLVEQIELYRLVCKQDFSARYFAKFYRPKKWSKRSLKIAVTGTGFLEISRIRTVKPWVFWHSLVELIELYRLVCGSDFLPGFSRSFLSRNGAGLWCPKQAANQKNKRVFLLRKTHEKKKTKAGEIEVKCAVRAAHTNTCSLGRPRNAYVCAASTF